MNPFGEIFIIETFTEDGIAFVVGFEIGLAKTIPGMRDASPLVATDPEDEVPPLVVATATAAVVNDDSEDVAVLPDASAEITR